MRHLTYLLILLGCVVLTLPLEFVIGARVWRRPARAALAIAPPALIFIGWDLIGVARGWWTYGARYLVGVHLGSLPLEEVLFFLVVPLCALLTFEAVGICGRLLRGRGAQPAERVGAGRDA
ncbi:lycopene cyclase domain-containing protein [Allobranchiibius sp. GilTou73]|uniref:lycopene cyclase domain-containing protein n=1 Tax=Allobranchiibius sp. GilTou73 TaxID=2904523 RepID=UPI001F421920|nr:lycopene cyclase domain-containing protein [Allobranchiibius sp. GilTou73]UIJ35825.1 lycopene cyclase domain-containing protein [Allobranchiibius sp. GilTou73]